VADTAVETVAWRADPLIWGNGPRTFEAFFEPTCPHSKLAFPKVFELLDAAGEDRLRVKIRLLSQPWHLFSGVICRAIVAASTTAGGREAARRVMEAVYAERESFEFTDHASGPNLDQTKLVSVGLTPEDTRELRDRPAPGVVWKRRLQSLERFRVSQSYYLDASDEWIAREFHGVFDRHAACDGGPCFGEQRVEIPLEPGRR